MILEQIQKKLSESEHYLGCIGFGDDRLIIPSAFGLGGIYTSIIITSGTNCLIKHPVVIYETTEQAASFLAFCKEIESGYPQIRFTDDPIWKSIIAFKMMTIEDEDTFLAQVDGILLDFISSVTAIRESVSCQHSKTTL